jgi:hypothetical protein
LFCTCLRLWGGALIVGQTDLEDLDDDSSVDSLSTDDTEDYLAVAADPIGAEQRRRTRQAERERLRRSAGEPAKPPVDELGKLMPDFLVMLREVLAE